MMVALRQPCLLLLTFTFIFIINITQTYSNDQRKTYIVYMGSLPRDLEANSIPSIHTNMAQRVLGSDFAPDAVIHSYHKSFNGFVVKLTEAEAARMRELVGVISVFESKMHPVATTRSWDFVGLNQHVERQDEAESNIVVAVIDTGVTWSNAEIFTTSYSQSEEMKMKWASRCPEKCKCNDKIIGAMSFSGGKVDPSVCPHDDVPHGTHVASIIAGRETKPNGLIVDLMYPDKNDKTVRGGVPRARIAVYKVCRFHKGRFGCKDEDILGAFERAIEDEVHIISVSLAQETNTIAGCSKEYFNNSYAIGAFHAMEKNILTSVAAGNDGPGNYSTKSYAPWLLSVAASTIGRNFYTTVTAKKRDNNFKEFKGVSLNTYESQKYCKQLKIACPPRKPVEAVLACGVRERPSDVGELDTRTGLVLESKKTLDVADIYAARATVLNKSDFEEILKYNQAKIDKSVVEELSLSTDPSVASMSSRGPNPITPDILKPDIAAPGVHILAAWPEERTISGLPWDKRPSVKYNVQSGTSMACPHATAAAAYVKSFHPDWSPAAIKSALMTTATVMKPELSEGAEFAYGSGQINLTRATDPGLVYDVGVDNYIRFLCAEDYDEEKIKCLTKKEVKCSIDDKKKERVRDLNLPSFALSVNCAFEDGKKSCPVDGSFTRIVKNVGQENSKYKYEICPSPTPSSLKIEVILPEEETIEDRGNCLSFEKRGDEKTFTLKITGELTDKDKASASSWMEKVSASLIWKQVGDCGKDPKNGACHEVRSPIVVYNRNSSPERKCETACKPIVREGIYEFGYQEGREDASALVA